MSTDSLMSLLPASTLTARSASPHGLADAFIAPGTTAADIADSAGSAATAPAWAHALTQASARSSADATAGVGPWLAAQFDRVQTDLDHADQQLQALASGEEPPLHQVMLALEDARLSLQLLVQVRTRLLEATQEILRMPL